MQNMRNKSSYAETYGKDAEADHESSILAFKKFSDLPYTNLLANREYIEGWLLTAKETYYKDLLMRLLKAVHVHFHSKEPVQSLHKNSFLWTNRDEIQKPPRIDKLTVRKVSLPGEEERFLKFPQLRQAKLNSSLTGYKQHFDLIKQEARILSRDIKQRTIVRNVFNKPENVTNVPVDLTLSKKMKSKFIQGSKEINALYDDQEPKYTSYQGNFKGNSLKYDNPRLDKQKFGSTLLSVIPDPYIIKKSAKRSQSRFDKYASQPIM